jgi:hypothetical protein
VNVLKNRVCKSMGSHSLDFSTSAFSAVEMTVFYYKERNTIVCWVERW